MEFVIQQNLINEDQLMLIKNAVKTIPHKFVSLIPFTHEIISDNELTGTDFIPYGSTLLTTVCKELGWKGLHFDLSTFNYQAAVEHRRDMLNDEHIFTVSEAIKFLSDEEQHEQWFIRPSEDLKQFSGQVIEAKECVDWLTDAVSCNSSGTYNVTEDMMVVLAKPKLILAEWRWFVIDGKIIDGSMYRIRGKLVKHHETDVELIQEAQELADKWLPDPCCVMDLALVNDELKVIEFNCINSSGMYGHDIKVIFKALYKYHHNG
jgi:hypothetical protein